MATPEEIATTQERRQQFDAATRIAQPQAAPQPGAQQPKPARMAKKENPFGFGMGGGGGTSPSSGSKLATQTSFAPVLSSQTSFPSQFVSRAFG